jgi:hypothetical protein
VPGTNTLAFCNSFGDNEKKIIKFLPGAGNDVCVAGSSRNGPGVVAKKKKLFSSLLMTRPNKLECFSLETLSSQVLEFEGKARANPIGAPFSCFLLGQAPGVTSKC